MKMAKDKRRAEIAKDLDSYISAKRRKPIVNKIKELVGKRERRPVEEENIPVDEVEAVIKEVPIKRKTMAVMEGEPLWKKSYEQVKGVFSKKPDTEELELIEREAEEVGVQQGEYGELEEFEELEELEEEQKRPKQMFFLNFFSNLFKKKAVYESPEKEDVYQETNIKKVVLERPEVEADMKQMALVTQEILKRLSHEELQEFKNSMEFETYKDILRRYGLVKEEKK